MRKLIEVFPRLENMRMLFYFMDRLTIHNGVPWKTENIATQLDIAYILGRSGQKWISPMLDSQIAGTSATTTEYTTITTLLWQLHWREWQKQWDLLSAQYNPLENYDMTETMGQDGDVTTILHGKTVTRSGAEKQEADTTTPPTRKETAEVYGFNSAAAVPTGSTETKDTGKTTHTYENLKDTNSGTDTTTRKYTLTRHGNIGVTTAMQLVESQRRVLMWNYFNDVVFPDLDRDLTLPIY